MLGRNSYPAAHVGACRTWLEGQLATWRSVDGADFGTLVLALDQWFVHRLRGQEGKDGNALNEVRLVVGSIVDGGGVFTLDKTIKYDPARSVLGLAAGDTVRVDVAGFERLAAAYLDEIAARFPEK